jgi:hypothetical protein
MAGPLGLSTQFPKQDVESNTQTILISLKKSPLNVMLV